MFVTESARGLTIPTTLIGAVTFAVENTMTAICGEAPVPVEVSAPPVAHPCVAGIISFVGDMSWSLCWSLPEATAPVLMQKFAGMEIPFDSPDMGDAIGELVNVLAGDVVAHLAEQGITAKMSLPMAARGKPLELMPEKGAALVQLDYTSKQGPFRLQLISATCAQLRGQNVGQ